CGPAWRAVGPRPPASPRRPSGATSRIRIRRASAFRTSSRDSTRVLKIIAGQLWRMFGGSLLRIYLAGEVAVERGDQLLRDADLGGRQGRLALVYLVAERERAVTQSELAELLWPDSLPPSWPVALSAVISKLRQRLATLGVDRDQIIAYAFRCCQWRPPGDACVHREAAAAAVHRAGVCV